MIMIQYFQYKFVLRNFERKQLPISGSPVGAVALGIPSVKALLEPEV